MIAVNMIRYVNPLTMKMSDEQLRLLKLKADFMNEAYKAKHGSGNYEAILLEEAKKMIAN